jgi:hypothetical protein
LRKTTLLLGFAGIALFALLLAVPFFSHVILADASDCSSELSGVEGACSGGAVDYQLEGSEVNVTLMGQGGAVPVSESNYVGLAVLAVVASVLLVKRDSWRRVE